MSPLMVLARAFAEYPMVATLVEDPGRRLRASEALNGPVLRHAQRHGRVDLATEGGAVACWLPSERATISPAGFLWNGGWRLPLRVGLRTAVRFGQLGEHIAAIRRRHLPGPHWYLVLLAVDPDQQRRGAGSRLLQAGLARSDADRLPSYLETLKEANVRFYIKNGFEVVHQGPAPIAGLHVWGMLRQPK